MGVAGRHVVGEGVEINRSFFKNLTVFFREVEFDSVFLLETECCV